MTHFQPSQRLRYSIPREIWETNNAIPFKISNILFGVFVHTAIILLPFIGAIKTRNRKAEKGNRPSLFESPRYREKIGKFLNYK